MHSGVSSVIAAAVLGVHLESDESKTKVFLSSISYCCFLDEKAPDSILAYLLLMTDGEQNSLIL